MLILLVDKLTSWQVDKLTSCYFVNSTFWSYVWELYRGVKMNQMEVIVTNFKILEFLFLQQKYLNNSLITAFLVGLRQVSLIRDI